MVSMLIRHATLDDLDAVAALEAACFPAAEAAGRESLRGRLAAYPDGFWLLVDGTTEGGGTADGELVAMVNGFATDLSDLTDAMYDDPGMHDPNGAWRMIFGVDTAPARQGHGHATRLLRQVIADDRAAGRTGLVLTCKDRLVGFYARLGFLDEGMSSSTHGNVAWHQMRLTF